MGTAEGDPVGGGGRSDNPSTADARRAAERFGVGVSGVRPFGRGHINDTYLALTAIGELVVQRLNQDVFPDPEAVGEVSGAPGGTEAIGELTQAVRRVPMARRFHNDAVRAARAVREHRVVRWLRLAGHAPFPLAFEMDDEPPQPLTTEGAGAR